MKKNIVRVVSAGGAALLLGGGLFAWSSTNLTSEGGEVVAGGNVSAGCTTAPITVAQSSPVWDGSAWTLGGAVVSTPEDLASTCAGLTVTLTGYDQNGLQVAGLAGSNTIQTANGVAVSETVNWAPVPFDGVETWAVTIS